MVRAFCNYREFPWFLTEQVKMTLHSCDISHLSGCMNPIVYEVDLIYFFISWQMFSPCGRTRSGIGICCLGRLSLAEGAGLVPDAINILGMHNQDTEETTHSPTSVISLQFVRSRASYILPFDSLDPIELPVEEPERSHEELIGQI